MTASTHVTGVSHVVEGAASTLRMQSVLFECPWSTITEYFIHQQYTSQREIRKLEILPKLQHEVARRHCHTIIIQQLLRCAVYSLHCVRSFFAASQHCFLLKSLLEQYAVETAILRKVIFKFDRSNRLGL